MEAGSAGEHTVTGERVLAALPPAVAARLLGEATETGWTSVTGEPAEGIAHFCCLWGVRAT
ncbi:hypothetical protein [Streptosporangium sp. KLBMP 9127]